MSASVRVTLSHFQTLSSLVSSVLLVVVAVMLGLTSAHAQVPPVPTAVSPSGTITDNTPEYVFSEEAGVVSYQLQIQVAGGRRYQKWFRTRDANCRSGRCSVNMPQTIRGRAYWRVRTSTADGRGRFSRFTRFTVSTGNPRPDRLTLISPSTDQSGSSVTYRWSARAGATRYQVLVVDSNKQVFKQWYTPAEVGCRSRSASSCSVVRSDGLTLGSVKWLARVQTDDGFSPWSRPLRYDLLRSGPQTPAVTQIDSPAVSEPVRSRDVIYRWQSVAGATRYDLSVTDVNGQAIQETYEVSVLGCAPVCTLVRSQSLPIGETKFALRAFSPSGGFSPWSASRSYRMEFRRQLLEARAVTGSVEKDVTHEFAVARGLWINLKSLSGDADLKVTTGNRTICQSSLTTEDNCIFSSLTNGIVKITGVAAGLSRYSVIYQQYHPDCFKQPTLLDTTYLSAKFRTSQQRIGLTRVNNNVCADTTYYKRVDPSRKRATFDGWLRTNGFLKSGARKVVDKIVKADLVADVKNAQYHNMIDLGFGRDMYCRRDGAAARTYPCVVQNYLMSSDLTVASSARPSFQVSVTMEYLSSCRATSRATGCGPVAFYVYDNKGRRISNVDLDGRGRKSVPQVCHSCHSGEYEESRFLGITLVSKLEGGTYLPFDEDLFGEFDRDQPRGYSPFISIGGINRDTRALNTLLKPILPLLVRGDGTLRLADESLGHFISGNYFPAHGPTTFQAKVRSTFCAVCHVAVKGTYSLNMKDEIRSGTNCLLCHNSVVGGDSNSRLAGHLCASGTGRIRMPNARTTHRALNYAWRNTGPYDKYNSATKEFIDRVCGKDAPPARPR